MLAPALAITRPSGRPYVRVHACMRTHHVLLLNPLRGRGTFYWAQQGIARRRAHAVPHSAQAHDLL